MIISAGLLILHNNKILLVHPTNAPWFGSYSIPKGEVEKDEDLLHAAYREAQEELGINLNNYSVYDVPQWIEYKSKSKHTYKKVCYFLMWLENEISGFHLQQEEVDWAGFLDKDEAEIRISPRLKDMLKHLK
jgi:ADP-ribose pyrophosphatase YjhB (NUDIX family)